MPLTIAIAWLYTSGRRDVHNCMNATIAGVFFLHAPWDEIKVLPAHEIYIIAVLHMTAILL